MLTQMVSIGQVWFHPTARYELGFIVAEIFSVGSVLSHLPVRLGAISIEAEIFNIDPAGWHMFTYNIHEAAGPPWRSCSTHLPGTEPAASQVKYSMNI